MRFQRTANIIYKRKSENLRQQDRQKSTKSVEFHVIKVRGDWQYHTTPDFQSRQKTEKSLKTKMQFLLK